MLQAILVSERLLVSFEMEREDGGITSRIIDIFYKHPSNFISTILVGNNIALVIYGILMAKLIDGLIIQTIVSTIIVLFTGEFLPKMLFRINPNRMIRICAFPAMLFYILLWPISKITSGLSHMILFLLAGSFPTPQVVAGSLWLLMNST